MKLFVKKPFLVHFLKGERGCPNNDDPSVCLTVRPEKASINLMGKNFFGRNVQHGQILTNRKKIFGVGSFLGHFEPP